MSNIIDLDFYRKFHVILHIEKGDLKFFIENSIKLLLSETLRKTTPDTKKKK